jgi:hypothetical protein
MHHHPLRRQRLFHVGAAVFVGLSLWPLAASAHHGWSVYANTLSDISGTVESPISMAGAHATMKVNAEGHVWNVVLAPPARSEAAGLKEGMIPVGDKVVVHGQRHRDPKMFEIKTTRLTWNGRVFSVYSDRP